jgi:hypothetical protein
MFERYTDAARRALLAADHEARDAGSHCVGPEHVLLGILREDRALTHRFLHDADSVDWYRAQIEDRTTRSESGPCEGELPLSEATERVLEFATEEAGRMEHEHIHTEHLFLALLREESSIAAGILHERGLQLSSAREQIEHSWQERTRSLRMKLMRAPEPRWPAFVAMAADALIHYALPDRFSLGPRWGLFAVTAVLLVPIIISPRLGRANIARILTFVAIGVLAVSLIGSLSLLIAGLPTHKDSPEALLRSAALLWITNILVFALWYWKLDAGGPFGRAQADAKSSFLFPQMMLPPAFAEPSWSPNFIDYLFLAFNTSTAFSPTDTAVLSRWAKGLMTMQSIISLSIVALLAARAINVL